MQELLGHARGSSPLTRGALVFDVTAVDETGLIPAHAGSTTMNAGRKYQRRAHPRSRGEHQVVGVVAPGGRGSSPLTRGARI